MTAVHRFAVLIPDTAIDANGHANNVEYVHWMRDRGSNLAFGFRGMHHRDKGGWRLLGHPQPSCQVLLPSFAGDRLLILTWVSTLRKASSLRKYLFLRERDRAVVTRGETNWVFVEARNSTHKPIPREVSSVFAIVPVEREPAGWE